MLDIAYAPIDAPFQLLRNTGDGFADIAIDLGLAFSIPRGRYAAGGIAFGDVDLDGDLDLAIGAWQFVRLFLQQDDGTFLDASAMLPASAHASFAFLPRWADLDGDRYPELLLIGDFATSVYLMNDTEGGLVDITHLSRLNQRGTEMGLAIADFDRDSDFDLFVPAAAANSVYVNEGGHVFQEVGDDLWSVPRHPWGWAAVPVDLNHDGWVDVAATAWRHGAQPVHLNAGTVPLAFLDRLGCIGAPDERADGWGLANVDFDNDGDQDLAYFNNSGFELLRNDNQIGNWIRVFLDTSARADLAPDGIGATVRVEAGAVSQIDRIDAGPQFMSQSEMSAHFGLADHAVIDSLTVDWPDGDRTVLHDVPVNQSITISATCSADIDNDGHVGILDVLWFLDGWFANNADFDGDGETDGADLLDFIDAWLACAVG